MVAPSRANSPAETGSSVEADLQPFREAIALHGENEAPQWKPKPAMALRAFSTQRLVNSLARTSRQANGRSRN